MSFYLKVDVLCLLDYPLTAEVQDDVTYPPGTVHKDRTIALSGQSDPTSAPTVAPSETWLGMLSVQFTVQISFHTPPWLFLWTAVQQESQLLPPLLRITQARMIHESWTSDLFLHGSVVCTFQEVGCSLLLLGATRECISFLRVTIALSVVTTYLMYPLPFPSPKMKKSEPLLMASHSSFSFPQSPLPELKSLFHSFFDSLLPDKLKTDQAANPSMPQVYNVSSSCSGVDRLKEDKEI